MAYRTLDDMVAQYYRNKEIVKERNDENKMLLEEIMAELNKTPEQVLMTLLPSGEVVEITRDTKVREVLDKEGLAAEAMVDVSELKTPYDFSALTKNGVITPAMITKHTYTERVTKPKLKKRKAKRKDFLKLKKG